MKLDQYLRDNSITEAAFAREVGISQAHVHRLRTGGWPSMGIAVRIREVTGGQVTADDFVPPPDEDAGRQ